MNITDNIWIIGAGEMAVEYSKVLAAMHQDYFVVGRGEKSANLFKNKTGVEVYTGGVEKCLTDCETVPDFAIVAVYPNKLCSVTMELLRRGVKNILVEKPGGLNFIEINTMAELAIEKGANVYIAYNRRFYTSVKKAKEIINDDGGVKSFNFEFTEWGHVIEQLDKPQIVLNKWFLANSTHVVDLAFYLGGKPVSFSSYVSGGLSWHPSASIYSGCGKTCDDILFTYKANWGSAGRWSLEVLTDIRKLIFEPIEGIKEMKKGSTKVDEIELDDEIDKKFKPGLYRETEAFISDKIGLTTIEEQLYNMKIYEMMEKNVNVKIFDRNEWSINYR